MGPRYLDLVPGFESACSCGLVDTTPTPVQTLNFRLMGGDLGDQDRKVSSKLSTLTRPGGAFVEGKNRLFIDTY